MSRRRAFEDSLPADYTPEQRRRALEFFDKGEANRANRPPDAARMASGGDLPAGRSPTPPSPERRQKAPERPVERPEKANRPPAPAVDPTAAALQRVRDPSEARAVLSWIAGEAPPLPEPWRGDVVYRPYMRLLADAHRLVAEGQAADVTAALVGNADLAARLCALAQLAGEVEDPDPRLGTLLARAAAHVPKPIRRTGHTWQILPAGALPKAPGSYVEYEVLELPLQNERRRELPGLGVQEPPAQLTLFGEDEDLETCLHLVTAETYGFRSLRRGRGARLDKRLLVDAMSAAPISERRPGGRYEWDRSIEELAADHWARWRPGENGRQLLEALQAIRTGALVRLADGRFFAPVTVRYLPDPRDLESRVVFEILYPEDLPVGGPRYNRPALLAAGRVSDPAFDLELNVAWHLDALRNPLRKAPGSVLGPEVRRRFAFGPHPPRDKGDRSRQRKATDTLLEALEAAGRLRIERLPTGWRLSDPLPAPLLELPLDLSR